MNLYKQGNRMKELRKFVKNDRTKKIVIKSTAGTSANKKFYNDRKIL